MFTLRTTSKVPLRWKKRPTRLCIFDLNCPRILSSHLRITYFTLYTLQTPSKTTFKSSELEFFLQLFGRPGPFLTVKKDKFNTLMLLFNAASLENITKVIKNNLKICLHKWSFWLSQAAMSCEVSNRTGAQTQHVTRNNIRTFRLFSLPVFLLLYLCEKRWSCKRRSLCLRGDDVCLSAFQGV